MGYQKQKLNKYIKMKFILAASLLSAASAFTSPSMKTSSTALNAASTDSNGWVPDENAFAFGLPGSLAPVGDFDLGTMKRYREAETTHGRVAMLSIIGFLVQESGFHPLFETANKDIGAGIRHLDEVRSSSPVFFEILIIAIGAAEASRALKGWVKPGDAGGFPGKLNDEYYPGDIGFDPLGLKPTTFEEFSEMSTKELQHGRLAMLASMGFIAQELVNEKPILENLLGSN